MIVAAPTPQDQVQMAPTVTQTMDITERQQPQDKTDESGAMEKILEEQSVADEMAEDANSFGEGKSEEKQEPKSLNKNLEIRRLSATEEGNKILNEDWVSPDKNSGSGKTPLEMVESIVSNMEMPSPSSNNPSATSSPGPAGTESPSSIGGKPGSKAKLGPKIAPATQPSKILGEKSKNLVPGPRLQPITSGAPVTNPPVQIQGVQQPQPQQAPVMQLVNTINGPVLMQAMPVPVNNPGLVQVPASSAPVTMTPAVTSVSMAQAQVTAPVGAMAGKMILKKRGKKKKEQEQVSKRPAGPVPILMSPVGAIQGQHSPQGQIVAINQPPPGSNIIAAPAQSAQSPQGISPILPQPNLVLNQAGQVMTNVGNQMILSNGTLVQMPAMQAGVVLNQMPDGTLYQVQNPPGMLATATPFPMIQPGQPIITTNGQFTGPIFVNQGGAPPSGAPVIQGQPGGTFIMTPQGLVQATPIPPTSGASSVSTQGTKPVSSQSSPGSMEPKSSPKASTSGTKTSLPKVKPPPKRRDTTTTEDDDDDDSGDDDDDDEDEVATVSKEMTLLTKIRERNKQAQALETDESDDDDDDDEDENDDHKGNIIQEEYNEVEMEMEEEETREDDNTDDESEEEKSKTSKLARKQVPKRSRQTSSSPAPSTRGRGRGKSTPEKSKTSPKTSIQSNQVDSSGLKATPPHSGGDFDALHTSKVHDTSSEQEIVSTSAYHDTSLDTSGASASTDDGTRGSPGKKKRRKRNVDELLKEAALPSDGKNTVFLLHTSLESHLNCFWDKILKAMAHENLSFLP